MSLDLTDPLQVLAGTIYGEARGEIELGKKAIASVVLNRVKHGGWWGNDILSVCLKPYQFSCWLENDPNRQAILNVSNQDNTFLKCLNIAQSAVDGKLFDVTGGADSYERIGTNAFWARGLQPCAKIGNHEFFITV